MTYFRNIMAVWFIYSLYFKSETVPEVSGFWVFICEKKRIFMSAEKNNLCDSRLWYILDYHHDTDIQ